MGSRRGPSVRWALVALAAALLVGLGMLGALSAWEAPAPASTDLNHIAARVAATWPRPQQADLGDMAGQVLIVDAQGQVMDVGAGRGSQGGSLLLLAWSSQHRPLTSAVIVDGRTVAWVLLDDRYQARTTEQQHQVLVAAAGILTGLTTLAAGIIVWVRQRVLLPFRRLDRFATQVAAGNVEAPLAMNTGGGFGAWAQGLDVLRTELEASRRREAQQRASKAALLAQIGHDLRTPVSTICATAELLELAESGADGAGCAGGSTGATAQAASVGSTAKDRGLLLARLALIRAKSQQVDKLLTDLFSAHSEELEALNVSPQELDTSSIAALVRQADHRGLVRLSPFPQVLVRFDPLRLAQVLDNVIHNSYKYAATPIDVSAYLEEDMLMISVEDHGPGVNADETDLIFARGHRGRSATDHPGQGLGLFTSAQLMERMGGHIQASLPGRGGLRITLSVPLA